MKRNTLIALIGGLLFVLCCLCAVAAGGTYLFLRNAEPSLINDLPSIGDETPEVADATEVPLSTVDPAIIVPGQDATATSPAQQAEQPPARRRHQPRKI